MYFRIFIEWFVDFICFFFYGIWNIDRYVFVYIILEFVLKKKFMIYKVGKDFGS